MSALELPPIPRSGVLDGERVLIPWLVRSLLHSRGIDTATLTPEEFLRLDRPSFDKLAATLLDDLTIADLRANLATWAAGLRRRMRGQNDAA